MEFKREDVEFLKNLKKELETQNSRYTSNPLYVIMDKKELVTAGGYEHRSCWMDEEGTEWETLESLFDYLEENYSDYLEENYSEVLDGLSIKEKFLEDHNDGTEEIYVKGLTDKFTLVHLQKFDNIKGSGVYSFFENDAKEHLESNRYHYNKGAHTHACSLWRSPRMEKLLNWIQQVDLGEDE